MCTDTKGKRLYRPDSAAAVSATLSFGSSHCRRHANGLLDKGVRHIEFGGAWRRCPTALRLTQQCVTRQSPGAPGSLADVALGQH